MATAAAAHPGAHSHKKTDDDILIALAVLFALFLAWELWKKRKITGGGYGGGSFTGPSGALDHLPTPRRSSPISFKFPDFGGGPKTPSKNVTSKPPGWKNRKRKIDPLYDAQTATIPFADLPTVPPFDYPVQSVNDPNSEYNLYAGDGYGTSSPEGYSTVTMLDASGNLLPVDTTTTDPVASGYSTSTMVDSSGNPLTDAGGAALYDSTASQFVDPVRSPDDTTGSIDSTWDQSPSDGSSSWYSSGNGNWWDSTSGGSDYQGANYYGDSGGGYSGGGGDSGGGGGGGSSGGDSGGDGGDWSPPGDSGA